MKKMKLLLEFDQIMSDYIIERANYYDINEQEYINYLMNLIIHLDISLDRLKPNNNESSK